MFANGQVPRIEYAGQVLRAAWTVPGATSTYDLLAPLREQLVAAGFDVLVDCDTASCGGFDFRFAVEVLPEPAMHVDLGDYRYLAAQRDTPEGREAVALMVSHSDSQGFVQIDSIVPGAPSAPAEAGPPVATTPNPVPASAAEVASGALAETLDAQGYAVLDDLVFDSGSTELGQGSYTSLQQLAAYLKAHPERTVAVVGHTDATGGLDVNILVSRRRAASVVSRLIAAYGVPRGQVSGEGVGFLSPRDTNLTEDGRTRNRRVEVVLTSTG